MGGGRGRVKVSYSRFLFFSLWFAFLLLSAKVYARPQGINGYPVTKLLNSKPKCGVEHGLSVRPLLPRVRVVRRECVGHLVLCNFDIILSPRLGDLREGRSDLLGGEFDTELGVDGEETVQRANLLVHLLKPLGGINPEAEHVPTAKWSGLDHECEAELGVTNPDTLDLEVRNGHVEVLSHAREPHQPDVADVKCTQVTLVRRKVPHTRCLREDLLAGQQQQLLIPDDGPTELEVAIELGGLVGAVHRLDRRKVPGGAADKVGENEFEAGAVELCEDVEGLGRAPNTAVRGVNSYTDDTIVTDTEVDPHVLRAEPDNPQVGDTQLSSLAVVTFSIFDTVDHIDLVLPTTLLELTGGNVEPDLTILPDIVLFLRHLKKNPFFCAKKPEPLSRPTSGAIKYRN
eukprot:Hpha_TRINITY_DN15472_c3_g1::TRINITY_DN15472_c3_g1_i1::g.175848::m.175848